MRVRGFTLIEVMVALVVFAIAAITLGATYVNVLNAYHVVNQSDGRKEEIRFARAQFMAEPDRVKAEEGGDYESATYGRVSWRAKIEPSTIADVFEVTFTCEVAEPNANANRNAKASAGPAVEHFMLLRPTWSEGVDVTKLRQNSKDKITELRRKAK